MHSRLAAEAFLNVGNFQECHGVNLLLYVD
jgi:hypothetical protein